MLPVQIYIYILIIIDKTKTNLYFIIEKIRGKIKEKSINNSKNQFGKYPALKNKISTIFAFTLFLTKINLLKNGMLQIKYVNSQLIKFQIKYGTNNV